MASSLEVIARPAEAAEATRTAVALLGERTDPVATFPTLMPQALVAYAAGDWRRAVDLANQASGLIAQGFEPHMWLIIEQLRE
jgi:hypothetical protein